MGELAPPNNTIRETGRQTEVWQSVDYFAEQNQKRFEKKQKMLKIWKIVLLIAGIILLIVVVVTIVLIIANQSTDSIVVEDDYGAEIGVSSALSGVQNLNEQVTEVYSPTYSLDANGNVVVSGNLEAVEATYRAALNNPANQKRVNTIRLSQMIFYAYIDDNERVVKIANDVDPSGLNMSEKVRFYNLTYLAYVALGDEDSAAQYYRLMRETVDKMYTIGG